MLNSNKSLSIVIPVRNTPIDLLDRCLNSVHVASKNGNCRLNIIVIDDFSDLNQYKEYMSIIRKKYPSCIHRRLHTWKGSGEARNQGVKLSDAEYILPVDSDDVLRPDAISVLMDNADPERIAFANHEKRIEELRKEYEKQLFLTIYNKEKTGFNNPFLYLNFIGFPAIIPRRVFLAVGGYPKGITSGDHVALWGRIFLNDSDIKMIYIDQVLYEYHIRKQSSSTRDKTLHIKQKSQEFMKLWGSLGKNVNGYITYNGGRSFPTLYVPIFSGTNEHIPRWAKIKSDNTWVIRDQLYN